MAGIKMAILGNRVRLQPFERFSGLRRAHVRDRSVLLPIRPDDDDQEVQPVRQGLDPA